MAHIASFGSWKSPITSDLIASGSIKFGQVVLDGPDIYWIDRWPAEKREDLEKSCGEEQSCQML